MINCSEENKNFATQSRVDRELPKVLRQRGIVSFPSETYFECDKPMES